MAQNKNSQQKKSNNCVTGGNFIAEFRGLERENVAVLSENLSSVTRLLKIVAFQRIGP